MQLSRRLGRVAANMQSGGVVADIGCDHGFTSIYLVQQGLASGAIAMDVNRGPLQRAAEHVEQYGLMEKIQLRLSDGLQELAPGEADEARELVLSPQSEIFLVRRKIHELGYTIAWEEMVEDQKKYYVILRAVPGREAYQEQEYLYGRKLIQERDAVFREFLEKEFVRLGKVELHIYGNTSSPQGKARLEKCLEDKENIRRLLNKMEH